jgi:hypothetical protein
MIKIYLPYQIHSAYYSNFILLNTVAGKEFPAKEILTLRSKLIGGLNG